MRLDKYISYALNITRAEARALIHQGKLKVNQEAVLKANFLIKVGDSVYLEENELNYQKYVYLMMNKPQGYLSSRVDENSPSVFNLLSGYEKYQLVIAGRLDLDSEGLLLFTNDGQLVHQLTSPNYDCPKKYYVLTYGWFKEEDVLTFKKGFMIKDGKNEDFMTKPALLEIISAQEAYITISEGKFHQIKRMCQEIGKEVKYLKRLEIGSLKLDQKLRAGEYRLLEAKEIEILKKHSHN
ncbi:MAG: pseudouridine synthase [Bacilli bacterium]|nr:pseudouridine synthase [Bacilli bacterium]